jgi:hypothetical protein
VCSNLANSSANVESSEGENKERRNSWGASQSGKLTQLMRVGPNREGSFPITYLDFPIADSRLTMVDWEGLVALVEHRVNPWQGRFMSSAAHLTLINSSLSSLPTHAMGLFVSSRRWYQCSFR